MGSIKYSNKLFLRRYYKKELINYSYSIILHCSMTIVCKFYLFPLSSRRTMSEWPLTLAASMGLISSCAEKQT